MRKVEGDLDVVIAERVVLLGVEDLEQRGRRITAEVGAELVDLVQEEYGVARARPSQALHDPTRHGADIGSPVAADLGLVAHPAERGAGEVTPHGPCDGAPERRLADAGRPDETEDGALGVGRELAHGEELEDALLDLLEVVVVGIEHFAGGRDIELVFGLLRPRQLGHPFDVGPNQVAVGRVLREGGQPFQLAFRLGQGVFREVGLLDLLAQLFDLADPGVALAELLLDLAHAPPQQALAPPRIHLLGFRLVRKGTLRLRDRDLSLEMRGDAPQAFGWIRFRQQCDLLFRGQRQRRADHVRHQSGRADARDEVLPLVGVVVVEVDDLLCQGCDAPPQLVELAGIGLHVHQRLEAHGHRRRQIDGRSGPGARDADDDRLLAPGSGIDDAQHPRHAGDREQLFHEGIFGGRIALGGDDHEAAFAGALQRRQRLRATD
jgi:hypothetical protein